jgi:malate dehydrogenase (oxaloacetate-decarboxylating)(NADP+)
LAKNPKRVIFAEGEEDRTIRAAAQWINNNYGSAILVGRAKKIKDAATRLNLDYLLKNDKFIITNSALSKKVDEYVEFLYKRLQRSGFLRRDIARMIKTNRNYFAATMLASGDGDTMITGSIRGFEKSMQETTLVLQPKKKAIVFGMSIMLAEKRTLFISDTTAHETPTPQQLVDIAIATAAKAREFGHEPRVAMLSYSNFGSATTMNSDRVREAVKILDTMKVDFEYEGEMNPDVALNPELMNLYPFCRLTAPANVLIMPGLYSASLSSKLLQELSNGVMLGPVIVGLEKPAQIITPKSTVSDIMNAAALSCVGH